MFIPEQSLDGSKPVTNLMNNDFSYSKAADLLQCSIAQICPRYW